MSAQTIERPTTVRHETGIPGYAVAMETVVYRERLSWNVWVEANGGRGGRLSRRLESSGYTDLGTAKARANQLWTWIRDEGGRP